MHVSDALISPSVALGTVVISVSLMAISSRRVKNSERTDLIPLMGVMGAFVFAAQMINFAIPGTGSSGHLIGGILLASILGPWCAFITLCSILIVQCLFFADGGILALGCNILNMAATSCLIAYPLVYRPITGKSLGTVKIFAASILSSVFALELGAFGVTVETELSGITALPFGEFIKYMLPIHLVIGLIEGIVTASLLVFLAHYRPEVLYSRSQNTTEHPVKTRPVLWIAGTVAFVLAATFSLLASENPDGLEWSVEKVTGLTELPSEFSQPSVMSGYDSGLSGIIGSVIVMVLLWGLTSLIFQRFKKTSNEK